ncbi:MAG: sulfotransferase [Oryzomonas sp.]|jgi:hypothetical protein
MLQEVQGTDETHGILPKSLHKTLCALGSAALSGLNGVCHSVLADGRPFVSLDEADLLETSRRRTGLDDFGNDLFREPLGILLDSFERDADLNLVGRICVRSEITRMLCNRLYIEADCKHNPEIHEEKIQRPLFITGLPRSGSTFLHTLLAQDPRCRTPRIWEVMHPSPPPERASYETDPRIGQTERQLKWLDILMPEFEKYHLIHARYPQECIAITDHAFLSYVFETMYQVSGYRDWHDRQDKRPAYEFHRRFLQHLQWRCPGSHWVLKAPSHLMALEALLAVYPDADIVVTHRDPLKVLPSCASLTRVLRAPFTSRLRGDEISGEVCRRWEGSTRDAMRFREERQDLRQRFYDVQYADVKRDPLAVVRGIYGYFGRELDHDAEEAMQRFAAANPKDKNGVHRYSLEEFGLDRDAERSRFQFYTNSFRIAPEV